MPSDQVSVSFRTLIEKCLKQAMSQNGADSATALCREQVDLPPQSPLRGIDPEVRTEVNHKVIYDFLRN